MVVPARDVRTLIAPAAHEILQHLTHASRRNTKHFGEPLYPTPKCTDPSELRGELHFCGKPEPKR